MGERVGAFNLPGPSLWLLPCETRVYLTAGSSQAAPRKKIVQ